MHIYDQERRWGPWGESDMGGHRGPVPDHAACPRCWQHTGAGTRPRIASRRRPYDATIQSCILVQLPLMVKYKRARWAASLRRAPRALQLFCAVKVGAGRDCRIEV